MVDIPKASYGLHFTRSLIQLKKGWGNLEKAFFKKAMGVFAKIKRVKQEDIPYVNVETETGRSNRKDEKKPECESEGIE